MGYIPKTASKHNSFFIKNASFKICFGVRFNRVDRGQKAIVTRGKLDYSVAAVSLAVQLIIL